jgi:hypothetical protein
MFQFEAKAITERAFADVYEYGSGRVAHREATGNNPQPYGNSVALEVGEALAGASSLRAGALCGGRILLNGPWAIP